MKTIQPSRRHGFARAAILGILTASFALTTPFVSPLARAAQLGTRSQTAIAPRPGSPERKRILDVLRAPVKNELKQNVVFTVRTLRVRKDWAFVVATPKQPNGKPINYAKTRYAKQVWDGMFDDFVTALLHRVGGKWKIVTYNIGATDAVWEPWAKDYQAPRAIFTDN